MQRIQNRKSAGSTNNWSSVLIQVKEIKNLQAKYFYILTLMGKIDGYLFVQKALLEIAERGGVKEDHASVLRVLENSSF